MKGCVQIESIVYCIRVEHELYDNRSTTRTSLKCLRVIKLNFSINKAMKSEILTTKGSICLFEGNQMDFIYQI